MIGGEDKLEHAINRGQKARELLANDLFQEAFAKYEADCLGMMLSTGPLERDVREKLYLAINVARKVKDHIGKLVADGKLAQVELRMRFSKPR